MVCGRTLDLQKERAFKINEHRADRTEKENGSGQLSGSDLCTPAISRNGEKYYLPSE